VGERTVRHCDLCKTQQEDTFGPLLRLRGVMIAVQAARKPVWGEVEYLLSHKLELCDVCYKVVARIRESIESLLAQMGPDHEPLPAARVVKKTSRRGA
jgi:hypothetical protein